eukprot:TRINITY_DN7944_c0_g1_i1.p1 TRINITY_DN7944_c0_g1~~TRINITY_DN7944_c0_g1_i1.p1  ORF type:complete len:361 (+),score=140.85 TRINITY_DN7944_c0_g1_i1:95-1084(+)
MGSMCSAEDPLEGQLQTYFSALEHYFHGALDSGMAAGVAAALQPAGDAAGVRDALKQWERGFKEADSRAAPELLRTLRSILDEYLARDSKTSDEVSEDEVLKFLKIFIRAMAKSPGAMISTLMFEELFNALTALCHVADAKAHSESETALRMSIAKGDVTAEHLRARLQPKRDAVRAKYQKIVSSHGLSSMEGHLPSAVSVMYMSLEKGEPLRRDSIVRVLCPLGAREAHLKFLNMLGLQVRGDAKICSLCANELHDSPIPDTGTWNALASSTHEEPCCYLCSEIGKGSMWTCKKCHNYDICKKCYASSEVSLSGALRELRQDEVWIRK